MDRDYIIKQLKLTKAGKRRGKDVYVSEIFPGRGKQTIKGWIHIFSYDGMPIDKKHKRESRSTTKQKIRREVGYEQI